MRKLPYRLTAVLAMLALLLVACGRDVATMQRAPTVVGGGISDIAVTEGAVDRVLTLPNFFFDPSYGADALRFEVVANSNSAVVSASLNGNSMTLSFGAIGSSVVRVRATNPDDRAVEDSFQVTVRAPESRPPRVEPSVVLEAARVNDSARNVDLSEYFSDDGQTASSLAYSLVSNSNPAIVQASISANTLRLVFGNAGQSIVRVRATNNSGLSVIASFVVSVHENGESFPNNPPVAIGFSPVTAAVSDADRLIDLTRIFSDPDLGDSLRFSVQGSSDPQVVRVSLENSILRLDFRGVGVVTVLVRATDNAGAFADAPLLVTVNPSDANLPVVIQQLEDVSASPGESLERDLRNFFSSGDGSALGFQVRVDPASASLLAAAIAADGHTLRLEFLAEGQADVIVTATNSAGNAVSQRFQVTITEAANGINQPPRIVELTATPSTLAEGASTMLRYRVVDPDGDTLSCTLNVGDGSPSFTVPCPNDSIRERSILYSRAGSYTLRLEAEDGRGGRDMATITIVVQAAANRPPTANDLSVSTPQDTAVAVTLSATDPDGNSLSYVIVSQPSQGSLSGVAPNLLYTPNSGFVGEDSFTFRANDGLSESNLATVRISVLAGEEVNRDPMANDVQVTTLRDTPLDIDVLANDTDPDGDPLSIVSVTEPANGSAEIVGNIVRYTPAAGFVGEDSFSYSISDGRGGSAEATVTVIVEDLPTEPLQFRFVPESSNCSAELAVGATCSLLVELTGYDGEWFGFSFRLGLEEDASYAFDSAEALSGLGEINVELVTSGPTDVAGVNNDALEGSGSFVQLTFRRLTLGASTVTLDNAEMIIETVPDEPEFIVPPPLGDSIVLP